MSDLRSEFRQIVAGLLPRIRLALPMPVTHEEIMEVLFPEWVEWQQQDTNLTRSMNIGTIGHYALHDRGNSVFWIKHPHPVPVGRVPALPFRMPAEFYKHREMVEWQTKARRLDEQIDAYTFVLYQLADLFKTKLQLASAWPEIRGVVPHLLEGVDSVLTIGNKPTYRKLREEFDELLPPTVKAMLTDMLATCVMLTPTSLPGWLGVHREDRYVMA